MTSNIRFWAYVNGDYVKITLPPSSALEHVEGGNNEEGYSFTQTIWEHGGEHLIRSYYTEARDCDGKASGGGESFCALADLREVDGYFYSPEDRDPAVKLPGWQDADQWQRDYQAEAAGY